MGRVFSWEYFSFLNIDEAAAYKVNSYGLAAVYKVNSYGQAAAYKVNTFSSQAGNFP